MILSPNHLERPFFGLDPALNAAPEDLGLGRASLIYLLGIGGVAMTSLAGLLIDKGFKVAGCDNQIYPPSSQILSSLSLTPFLGYGPETLNPRPDLVIVGNVVTAHFEVVSELIKLKIPYLSLPQTLNRYFLNSTKNVVVSGCHGKTSLTNLTAHLFERGGLRSGYLIGALSLDLPKAYKISDGEWFVIEGDEYDSAFFDKGPKFLHYKPKVVVLTSTEFDHADIYPNTEAVERAYCSLLELLPNDGLLIVNGDEPDAVKLSEQFNGAFKIVRYGLNPKCQVRSTGFEQRSFLSSFIYSDSDFGSFTLTLPKPGVYNAKNATAAAAVFLRCGGSINILSPTLNNLQGVSRRQELCGKFGSLLLYDDFAHHPTAVLETLIGFRQAYPKRRLICAFEPRSNTSRRSIFQKAYAESFNQAQIDLLFLCQVNQPQKAPPGDRLNVKALAQSVPNSRFCPSPDLLFQELEKEAKNGDVIVLMSNGDFGGLREKLIEAFKNRSDLNNEIGRYRKTPQIPIKTAKHLPKSTVLSKTQNEPALGPKGVIMGYCFSDPNLLEAALTHSSVLSQISLKEGDGEIINQRLEFLGDSVLNLCMAEILFNQRPRLDEGDMTRLRSYLVCESRLSEVAMKANIGPLLIMTQERVQHGGRIMSSALADSLEAIIGAIYLDGGFSQVKKVISVLWAPYLEQSINFKEIIFNDFKTRLQELCQKHKLGLPLYLEKQSYGPPHNKTFVMTATLPTVAGASFSANGASKKQAEQKAAELLLIFLLNEPKYQNEPK
ncbi:MAG: ribonuclease III [Deltaproteobacteria bacterium]|jgi:UDP-N-acetylmuramate: L-alanyl-gamma-D-glutamyl-meso-diaminopimelate ligase|nr:ribonuclease III [Deltaproteobacteria bacterium]